MAAKRPAAPPTPPPVPVGSVVVNSPPPWALSEGFVLIEGERRPSLVRPLRSEKGKLVAAAPRYGYYPRYGGPAAAKDRYEFECSPLSGLYPDAWTAAPGDELTFEARGTLTMGYYSTSTAIALELSAWRAITTELAVERARYPEEHLILERHSGVSYPAPTLHVALTCLHCNLGLTVVFDSRGRRLRRSGISLRAKHPCFPFGTTPPAPPRSGSEVSAAEVSAAGLSAAELIASLSS